MSGASTTSGPLFRVWITEYRGPRPQRWHDLPHGAVAVEPAELDCLSPQEAAAFLEGFNSSIQSTVRPLWAVAVPVVPRYEGDLEPGQVVPDSGGLLIDPRRPLTPMQAESELAAD